MSAVLDDALKTGTNVFKNVYNKGNTGVRSAWNSVKALADAPPTTNVAGATTPTATPVASPPVTPGVTPPTQPTPAASAVPTPEPVGVRAGGPTIPTAAADQIIAPPPPAEPFKFKSATATDPIDVRARAVPPRVEPTMAAPVVPPSTATDLALRTGSPSGAGYRPNFTVPPAPPLSDLASPGMPTGKDLIARPNFTMPGNAGGAAPPIPTAPSGGFGAPPVDPAPGSAAAAAAAPEANAAAAAAAKAGILTRGVRAAGDLAGKGLNVATVGLEGLGGYNDFKALTKPTDPLSDRIAVGGEIAAERGSRSAGILAGGRAGLMVPGTPLTKLVTGAIGAGLGGMLPEAAVALKNAGADQGNGLQIAIPDADTKLGKLWRNAPSSDTTAGRALAGKEPVAPASEYKLPSDRVVEMNNPQPVAAAAGGAAPGQPPSTSFKDALTGAAPASNAFNTALGVSANAPQVDAAGNPIGPKLALSAAATPGGAAAAAPVGPAQVGPESFAQQGVRADALRSTMAQNPELNAAGTGDVVGRGDSGLRELALNPQALQQFNALQTSRNNGITGSVDANGRMAFGNDPNVAATPVANTGFNLGAANEASARANATRDSMMSIRDPDALINGNGTAVATGTPMGSEPRMQVTPSGSLGGRIERRQQQQAIQNAQAQQEMGLRAQQQAIQSKQFGAELGLRSRGLDQTAAHNAATTDLARSAQDISRGQLQREGLRDQVAAQQQRDALAQTTKHNTDLLAQNDRKIAAEFGEGSIGNKRLANEQSEHVDKLASDAETKLTTSLGNSLPPVDGKPDTAGVQSYLSDMKATAAARADEARKAGNTDLAGHYDKAKLAAFSDADMERYKVGKQIKELARASRGSGPGSSTYVDSTDLKGYATLHKDQPNNLLFPDQVRLANGTVVPKALLTRTDNPNVYFPNIDASSPKTTRFTSALGLRSN